jgi:ADP-ribose pyrophosphatase YjhB (NUDIX family)
MSFEEVNFEKIRARKERLFEEFGEAPVRERHDTPDSETFEQWIEGSRSGYVGGAYALVRRPPDRFPEPTDPESVPEEEPERVLLIGGRAGPNWGIPGGGQEGDETYVETVKREVREEVGIEFGVTGLQFLRHEIATCEGYDERLHVLRAFFEGIYEDGTVTIDSRELTGAGWFADPPHHDRLMPATERVLERWDP